LCFQHAQEGTLKVNNKVSQGGGFKGLTQKVQHKGILVTNLIQNSKPKKSSVTTKYDKICSDCKQFEVDKAKPIEKLIAETRMNAKICSGCKDPKKVKEPNYLKPKGQKKKGDNKLLAPHPASCCTEECVGKRVYRKPLALSKKKNLIVRFVLWIGRGIGIGIFPFPHLELQNGSSKPIQHL
jgi:hypothetical protein